jgi:hypothetical protein
MNNENSSLPKVARNSIPNSMNVLTEVYARIESDQIDKALDSVKKLAKVIRVHLNSENMETSSAITRGLMGIKTGTLEFYNFSSLKTLSPAMTKILDSYQDTISKGLYAISEVLKSRPNYSFGKDIHDISSKAEFLAENGWVVYFGDSSFLRIVKSEGFEKIEQFWFQMLENKIVDRMTISKLEKSQYIPAVLVQSMIKSYRSGNYYAAYTMATIIIDGVMNRVSEKNNSKDNHVPVGRATVSILDKELIEKTFWDRGLLKWLYLFFENTNKFTLNWPNRHMINHGRWEEEISKEDFLKVFNTVLYLHEAVDNRICYVK